MLQMIQTSTDNAGQLYAPIQFNGIIQWILVYDQAAEAPVVTSVYMTASPFVVQHRAQSASQDGIYRWSIGAPSPGTPYGAPYGGYDGILRKSYSNYGPVVVLDPNVWVLPGDGFTIKLTPSVQPDPNRPCRPGLRGCPHQSTLIIGVEDDPQSLMPPPPPAPPSMSTTPLAPSTTSSAPPTVTATHGRGAPWLRSARR